MKMEGIFYGRGILGRTRCPESSHLSSSVHGEAALHCAALRSAFRSMMLAVNHPPTTPHLPPAFHTAATLPQAHAAPPPRSTCGDGMATGCCHRCLGICPPSSACHHSHGHPLTKNSKTGTQLWFQRVTQMIPRNDSKRTPSLSSLMMSFALGSSACMRLSVCDEALFCPP
jgi:hypothetical protein